MFTLSYKKVSAFTYGYQIRKDGKHIVSGTVASLKADGSDHWTTVLSMIVSKELASLQPSLEE